MIRKSKFRQQVASDLRTYYDTILTQLEDDKRPVDTVLFNVLARHQWGYGLPDDFSFEYQSLHLPTELEKSQIATADAQNVAGLFQATILDKAQALAALKDSSRVSGRYGSITDADIRAAEKEDAAPPLPEGFLVSAPAGASDVDGQSPVDAPLSLNGATAPDSVGYGIQQ
ncbi:MAG: DUF1073 domain-containing protein [Desulfovibrio sp.]|jgi:hypothetical protein|nr:DUF1073 domain-containing protein [Desulfovibrio sp.]